MPEVHRHVNTILVHKNTPKPVTGAEFDIFCHCDFAFYHAKIEVVKKVVDVTEESKQQATEKDAAA